MGKKSSIILFLIISVSLLNVQCRNKNAEKAKIFIELQEALSIGGIESDALITWSGIATDTRGNIYVSDMGDYSLKKFSAEGRLLKKVGKKGDGPGEFNSPASLRYKNGKVYVSEIYRLGILVFDDDLIFIKKIPVQFILNDFNVLSDDRIMVIGQKLNAQSQFESCLYCLDQDGKETEMIVLKRDVAASPNNQMMNMLNFAISPDEKSLALVYNFIDRLLFCHLDGKLVFENKIIGIDNVPTEKTARGEIPTKLAFRGVEFDGYGNIFLLSGDLSKNRARDVYVINKSGEVIGQFQLPEMSHLIYIDDKNNLYSRADEGVTLKKYIMKYSFAKG